MDGTFLKNADLVSVATVDCDGGAVREPYSTSEFVETVGRAYAGAFLEELEAAPVSGDDSSSNRTVYDHGWIFNSNHVFDNDLYTCLWKTVFETWTESADALPTSVQLQSALCHPYELLSSVAVAENNTCPSINTEVIFTRTLDAVASSQWAAHATQQRLLIVESIAHARFWRYELSITRFPKLRRQCLQWVDSCYTEQRLLQKTILRHLETWALASDGGGVTALRETCFNEGFLNAAAALKTRWPRLRQVNAFAMTTCPIFDEKDSTADPAPAATFSEARCREVAAKYSVLCGTPTTEAVIRKTYEWSFPFFSVTNR